MNYNINNNHSIVFPSNNISTDNNANSFVTQWNIFGLRHRLAELQLIISKRRPQAIMLQETLLPDNNLPPDFLRKYQWYTKQGPLAPNRNGVAIAVDRNVTQKLIPIRSDLQAIAVEIESDVKCTLVSVYIPPKGIGSKLLENQLLDLVRQLPSPCVMMGDFNASSQLWGSSYTDDRGRAVLRATEELQLVSLNDGSATRLDPNSGKMTALDLTFVSLDIAHKFQWSVDEDNHGSDHFPTHLSLNPLSARRPSRRPRWLYEQADWSLFQSTLDNKFNHEDVINIEQFTLAVIDAASLSVPRTSGQPGRKCVPWWGASVKQAIKIRRKALRKLRRLDINDPERVNALYHFRNARTAARKAIQQAKTDSWNRFLTSFNPETSSKALWNKIHNLCGVQRNRKICLSTNEGTITDERDLSDIFAIQFAKTSSTSNYPDEFQERKQTVEEIEISFDTREHYPFNEDFSMNELEWAIAKVSGNSAGPDDIGYPLLKHLPFSGKIAFLNAINSVWNEGNVPTVWKEAITIPIPKNNKSDRSPNSYRPISLLSCPGKIMERLVNRRLTTFLEDRKLLNQNQFAFRVGKGTDSHLAEFENIIAQYLAKGWHVDCAALDLEKAYDRLWRYPILKTLSQWGIAGEMGRYLDSFLQYRSFRVQVGGNLSRKFIQENGVPQGSVLSVTLFLIGMESIFKHTPKGTQILVYADDIVVLSYGRFPSLVRRNMQLALDQITSWTKSIGFKLSPEKSAVMHFSNNRRGLSKLPDLIIDDRSIPSTKSMKILGVTIDCRLKFTQHINNVYRNNDECIRLLRTISGKAIGANRNTMLQIMNSWLLPRMLYGYGLYSRSEQKAINKLSPIYHRALRCITGAFITSPISAILVECGVLPFSHIAAGTLIRCATRWLEKSPGRNDCPMVSRARNVFRQLTNHDIPEICSATRLAGRLWYESAPVINLSLLDNRNRNTLVTQARLNELTRTKFPNHKYIYTDGSVTEEASACGIWDGASNRSFRLPRQCSIFSTEAHAMLTAAEDLSSPNQPTLILSDSASCLKALQSGRSRHPWIQKLEVTAKSKNIAFCWVPRHAGIEGNEEADRLASAGRHDDEPATPIPARDAVQWAVCNLRESWQTEWLSEHNTFLRKIKSSIDPWRDNINPGYRKALTRLRIGHTRLTHSYLLSRSDPPCCQFCGDSISVDHLVTKCPGLEHLQQQLQIPTSIQEALLPTEEAEKKLIQYFKEINHLDKI